MILPYLWFDPEKDVYRKMKEESRNQWERPGIMGDSSKLKVNKSKVGRLRQ
jgi:hypothetical protein